MAQLNDGRVDILSRDDGSILSQANAGSSRTVLLNQPSIVKVHGTREMVAEYERQGNDLILHMKDGTTVRYQQFFFDDVDGDHSELVFDDGVKPPEHALFPVTNEFADAQTAMALTPTYESLGSIEPLLLADTGAGPGLVTAAGLGALGLVGVGAAAFGGGGGGGGGNDGDNGGGTNPPTPPVNTPTLTIGTFAGDNVLSAAEKETTQLLSGTTTNVQAGQTVVIILNGVTYNATVQANGSWSVAVPVSALEALANGSATISASVTNTAGQSANDTHNFTVETSPAANVPQIAIAIFAGNDVLDGAEKLTAQTLSGTTVNVQQGQTVTVTLNGKTYTGTVDADGAWSVSVPAADLTLLSTGSATASATVTNTGGISANATHNFNVQASATPSVSITSPVSDDGYLSADEAQGTLILQGSASGVPVGTAVSVTLGGHSYPAVTQADGSWTVTVPSADLQQLPQGSNLIVASITLANGTVIENSTTVSVDVITTAPVVQVDLPFGDGVLSGAEIGQPQTVTGHTGVTGPNQTVSIDFNGTNYPGTVNNDGSWTVTIPAGSVTDPTQGTLPLVVNVTDPAGNTGINTIQVTVDNTPPVVTVAPFDSALNAADITQPLVITGNSVGGKSVTVSLDGQTYTVPVDSDGVWSVNIPASALQQLDQGNNDLIVTSTDKYGNTSAEATLPLTVDTLAPTNVTLTPVTDDNYVSPAELATLTLQGTAEEGSIIRVFIGTRELTQTSAGNNNTWSIVLSDADKAALADGSYPIRVVATDAAGNETTVFGNVTLAVEPGSQPSIQVNDFAGDNILQNAELGVDQALSGRVFNVEEGLPLIVTFNGEQYSTTVLAGGLWSVIIPADALAGLTNGEFVNYGVSVSNNAGISALYSGNYPVANDPAVVTLAIAPISGDNWINATEAQSPVIVSGSSQNLQGTELNIIFNGKIYSATVGPDGKWSTEIPAADLIGIANNNYNVLVTSADDSSVSATVTLGVRTDFPDNVTVNAAFGGDNILNLTESNSPQTITGNTGLTLPDQTVSVQLNGNTYLATVDTTTGAWSVNVPVADLKALPQNSNDLIVTVRDAAGNVVTHNASINVDTGTLAPDVNQVAVDGVVNRTEQGQPLALSGTAEAGSIITVMLNGVTYTTAADGNGSWGLSIAPSTLQTLADGQYDIRVTARDSAGNEATTLVPITLDTASTPVTVAPISGDGYLNALEHNAALDITGTTEPGASVIVRVNNVDYPATVQPDGNWTVTLPANVVSGLADSTYTVTATATDSTGNTGSSSQPLTVIAGSGSLPGITVGAFADDNILDGAEKGLSQFVTGNTVNVQAGQTVTVSLNGSQYTGFVLSDGSWSVLVPASALHNLANGTDNYTVSVSDVAGNPASTNGSFTVDNTFSAIAIGVISDDNTLNAAEALLPLSIHGFSRFVASGSSVSVSFRGKFYLTTTNSDGSWTVTVPPADLANLTNTTLTVTASTVDINGNTITVEHALNSEVLPGFLLEVNPLFGDDYLNAAEAANAQTLSGTTGVEGAGQTVSIVIGGITYAGTVDTLGNWSVSVPSAVLQTLPQGANDVSVTVKDGAGNSINQSFPYTVDTVAPVVTLNAVATDNRISQAEQNQIQTLSGVGENGDRISVTLNNQTYEVTVTNGSWSIDLPVNDLKALPGGSNTLQVTSTDTAGNTTTVIRTIEVDGAPLTINPVAGDDVVNAQEAGAGIIVTGSVPEGTTTVVVTFNNQPYTAVVGSDGQWSATIPGTAFTGLPDSSYTLSVVATTAGGDSVTLPRPIVLDTTPPVFDIAVVSDGYLNASELAQPLAINGTGTAGDSVRVTLNNNVYLTTVDGDGNWSVSVPAGDLAGLGNTSYPISVVVKDPAGNTSTQTSNLVVDVTAPLLTLDPVTGDNIINASEQQSGISITGMGENGATIVVTLNSKTYQTTVGINGQWSVDVDATDLGALTGSSYPVSVVATDAAGNQTIKTGTVQINTTQPTITVDLFTGNGIVDGAEQHVSQKLTGTTTNVEEGQRVTLTLGGVTYSGLVLASGAWSIDIPATVLETLSNGQQNYSVSVSNSANTTITQTGSFEVNNLLSGLAISPISGDGFLNAQEALQPLVISGTSANFDAGTVLTISLNGIPLGTTAVVDANGNWTLTLQPGTVTYTNGPLVVSVSGEDATGAVVNGSSTLDVHLTNLPVAAVNPLFGGDAVLNALEAGTAQTVTGSTGVSGDGQTVSVTLAGITYTGIVDGSGNWSVVLPGTALAALPQNSNSLLVQVSDVAGNPSQITATFNVDTQAPNVTVNPVAGDGVLNAVEQGSDLAISGTGENGSTIVVTLHGVTYPPVIVSGGVWTVNIPAANLQAIPDGTYPNDLSVTATDVAQNSTTVTSPLVVKADAADLPTITVNTFAGNNIVDGAEQQTSQLLSGTTTHVEPGRTVTVTIGNQVFSPLVQSDGSWSVSIPSGALLALPNNQTTINVAVSDAAGNPASNNLNVTINNLASGISIDPISDGYLNAAEAQQPLIVTGHTANVAQGSSLVLNINGTNYSAIVGSGGAWSVLVPAGALAGLPDGQVTVTASAVDASGNPVSSSSTLNIQVHNLPNISVDNPFGDGTLNASEASQGQTLHGTSGVTGAGQTVSVLIGTTTYTGTVDSNGNWNIPLSPAVLQQLPQTGVNLVVTVTDAAGNSSSKPVSVAVDTVAPTISLNAISTDGVINASEATQDVTISGSSVGAQIGQTVTVVFNGQTYFTTITDANGSWALDIPAGSLTGVVNGVYTLTATVTDAAGNTSLPATTDVTLSVSSLQPTINTPFGDGYLSYDEAHNVNGQTLSGTTGSTGAGQTVTVTLNGQDYAITADTNGNWELPLTSTQLQNLGEGSLTITVEVTNGQGNTGTIDSSAIVDLTAPTLDFVVSGDNVINPTEIQQTVTLQGSASPDEAGQQVSIIFNNTLPAYLATVQDDGSWRFDLPTSATQGLADAFYTVTATLTDKAGNVTETTHQVEVRTDVDTLPTITVDAITGDDYLNTEELGEVLQLSGTTTNVQDGQIVTITFNGQTFDATVTGGQWSYDVPANLVGTIGDGPQQVSVTVTDIYGNVANNTHDFTVIARGDDLPSIIINPVTSDDMIDYSESQNANGITVTGSSKHIPAGETITVSVNGKDYLATVDSEGNWTANIPQADAQNLPQNSNTITATGNDVAGNTANASDTFTVHSEPPFLSIDANLVTDGILSLADALTGLVLSGTAPANLSVDIKLGSGQDAKVYSVQVNETGHWTTTIPSADLLALVDGELGISVSVKDAYGNTTEQILNVDVDVHAVTELTLDTPFLDGLLNGLEATGEQVITGTVGNLPVGASLVVSVGTLTGLPVTLNGDGTWTATIPAGVLVAQGNGIIQVSVSTEDAVNPVSISADAELVLTTTLSPTITTPFVDGLLDIAEAGVEQVLSGTTGLVGEGQTIELTINGVPYNATVDANGIWTATLTPVQLLALGNSTGTGHEIVVIIHDAAGNSAETSLDVPAIVVGLPTVTINPLSLAVDSILTKDEVAAGITLGGTVTFGGTAATTHVIVNVNGTPIEATINGDGTWSLPLSGSVLATLPDGNWPISVTVTDGVGNTGQAPGTSLTVAINNVPAPTITTPFVDGLLNLAEASESVGQVLRGSTHLTGGGQTVTVSIDGGTPVNATVTADGNWSLDLTSQQLLDLGSGLHTISVTASDVYGNESTVGGSYTAALTLPVPVFETHFTNDALGITALNGALTLEGSTGVTGANQGVVLKVDVNGISYTGTVDTNGHWVVELPAGALSSLSTGPHDISVTVTDAAGNTSTETLNFTAYATLPQPSVGLAFVDGYLNASELTNGGTLSGSTGIMSAGQSVSIDINGQTIPVTVALNGSWSITLGTAVLTGLSDASHEFTVTVTDPGGNIASITESFIVDTTVPTITDLVFAGNDSLNYLESLTTQTLTGKVNAADAGSTVTLTIGTGPNAQVLTGSVLADGTFSVNVSVSALTALVTAGGAYSVSITDAAGNQSGVSGSVGIDLTPPLTPSVTLNPVTGDNIINIADGASVTLTGLLHNATLGAGTLTITVGGTQVSSIPIFATGINDTWTTTPILTSAFVQGSGSVSVEVTYTPSVGQAVSSTTTVVVDTVAPTLTVGAFAGNDVLIASEAAVTQMISGTSSEVGATVSVTLGLKTYTAVVQGPLVNGVGNWSLNVPAGDLQGLLQTVSSITATVTDSAGNTTITSHPIVVDTIAPVLSLGVLAGDNVINSGELADIQLLSGSAVGAENRTVDVYLGNTLLATAAVGTDGLFSIPFGPAMLALLANGTNVLRVTVADANGNESSSSLTVSKILNADLALTVAPLFDNGYLSKIDLGLPHTITGTATSAIGGTVSLSIGGQNLTAIVGQDGKWSLSVPASALTNITDGSLSLNVVLTDTVGNTVSVPQTVTAIIDNVPVVGALTGLFGGDNRINVAEATDQLGQIIGGNLLNTAIGSTVTVTLGVKSYTTTTLANGAWSVTLSPADLQALGTGNVSLGVTVVDPAGNTASNTATIGVFNKAPEIALDTIFGDGVLSIADVTNFASQLISGTVKNVATGTVISLNLGGLVTVQATVDVSGKFSTTLTQAQILLLTGVPSLTVTASVTDVAGNHAEVTSGLQLSLTAPTLNLNQATLFGDGLLNAADALTTQLISGTTTAGSRVVVTVGNSTTPLVSATADAGGLFSLGLTPSLLASLADGALSLKVTVTDTAGNTTSNTLNATVGIHALPSVTLNPLFGDGVLSVAEALSSAGQLLSGHVNNVPTGTVVSIKVGGLTLQGSTDSSGDFGITLTSAQLLGLTTGGLTVSATVTDAVGNTASSSAGVTIGVSVQPTLTVGTLFGDGVLSAYELATTQTVSGTSTAVAGSTVTFTLNNHLYTATVGSSGSWSTTLLKADLVAQSNGTLTINATVTDPYGNTQTASNSANVIAKSTPTITFGTLFGDGALNAVEAQTTQTISGTTFNAEGSTILVHVGTQTYSTVVAANGSWSISVPSADLKALPDTTTSISADLVNGAGTSTGTIAVPVIVGTHTTPTVTLTNTAGFSDGYLNLSESGTAQTISGTSTNAAGGQVTVNLEGTLYTGTVASNGTWSVSIPSSGLTSLADGQHTAAISIADRAGNTTSTSTSFNAVTHNLPAIGVDPIASLLSVLLTGLTISGGTLRLAAGTTVNITLSQSGQTQTMSTTVGANGRYSAKFVGGLLSALNLSSVVTVTAVDAAGNPASTVTTLLLGSLLPLATTASVMMAVASDESLASIDTSSVSTTSSSEESTTATVHTAARVDSTLVTDSDTSSTDSATTTTASTTASSETVASTTDDGSYTIGGVTITLADGQTLHGDSVTGSVGNDTITVSTLDFTHIDGGAGTDTLVLNGEHITLDLTSLGLKIEHVEIIDLGTSGNNSIKLDLNEALNITDKQSDDLLIKGTLGDQVTLANTDGGVWATTGQRTVEGQTFDVYHNSALSSDNTLGDVLIQHNLQVHVV
ncbi:Ig-like domain-containing protein [Erwinia sp. AnSW2-5]|uniref:Ig-like domain-containing protein n=1 Tax=Erwinia sp. AnSW2-5 TaxID=3367692 RepID=UPI00385EF1CE